MNLSDLNSTVSVFKKEATTTGFGFLTMIHKNVIKMGQGRKENLHGAEDHLILL